MLKLCYNYKITDASASQLCPMFTYPFLSPGSGMLMLNGYATGTGGVAAARAQGVPWIAVGEATPQLPRRMYRNCPAHHMCTECLSKCSSCVYVLLLAVMLHAACHPSLCRGPAAFPSGLCGRLAARFRSAVQSGLPLAAAAQQVRSAPLTAPSISPHGSRAPRCRVRRPPSRGAPNPKVHPSEHSPCA